MKIHIRFDESNVEHTRFTLFVDGKNCGQLCMGTEDAVTFHMIVGNGISEGIDSFVSSGDVYEDDFPRLRSRYETRKKILAAVEGDRDE